MDVRQDMRLSVNVRKANAALHSDWIGFDYSSQDRSQLVDGLAIEPVLRDEQLAHGQ